MLARSKIKAVPLDGRFALGRTASAGMRVGTSLRLAPEGPEGLMTGWEMKIITAEAQRLLALAAEDADLRADLRALAREILAATEGPQSRDEAAPEQTPPEAVPASSADEGEPHGPTPSGVAQADREQETEAPRGLTLGRPRPLPVMVQHPPGTTDGPVADADLKEIEARCRLKAEAARWAAVHQHRIREGAASPLEDAPADPDIAAWADRLMDCFYWMNSPDASHAADLSLLDDVAGCFEAIAEAIAVVDPGKGRRGAYEWTLPLLAEAQSALRRALQRLHAPDDPDQVAVYEWVRQIAARHHVYLKRYMRADDPADPTRWTDLLARIEALAGSDPLSRKQRTRIEQVRHHLKPVLEGKGTDRDWQAVIEAVDQVVGAGVPPSNRAIRDLLLPVLDDLPARDDLPPGVRLVLREIDRYLATRTPDSSATVAHEPTAEVKETRRLLGGRSVVLIGGLCRREARKVLESALGLSELIWIATKEHQSIEAFEPVIARADVALVLLAIRWSSHAFGDVKQFCDRHDKPLVRLPGGYGPNQVAAQILLQCSGQLGGG